MVRRPVHCSVSESTLDPLPGFFRYDHNVKHPLGFCHFVGGSFRPFSVYWWREAFSYATRYFWVDCYRFYHRGRYGWSDIDAWGGQDETIAGIMSGMLTELADHCHGAPCGYPHKQGKSDRWSYTDEPETDFKQWEADLRRWAANFDHYLNDNYVELYTTDDMTDINAFPDVPVLKGKHAYRANYKAWHADEAARSELMHQTWREIEPWLESLWD